MRLLFALAALLAATPALAWGQTGHRISGEIADRHLGPKARAAVMEILGTESLAQASTWPDEMRSDPHDFWQKQAGPWHYVTVPPGSNGVATPPQGDSLSALARFSATVSDPKAPLADRQLALRFLIHIVGDLSQPLHVGDGSDRGGNDVKVSFFGRPTNLHALWDEALVDSQGLSFTEWTGWLVAGTSPAEMRAWSSPDPAAWIADSAAIRPGLYPASPDLGYAYVFQHRQTLKEQLAKGGFRVAAFLNRLFDTP